MARHKKEKGICRLCGNEGELTYEHVPPRKTYNKNTKFKVHNFLEFVKSKDIVNNPPKGKPKQGGIGFNTLCSNCNSFLGSNYVNEYSKFVSDLYENIYNQKFTYIEYELLNQSPLKILKAIISMFIAINDTWYLEEYPELSEFVLNPESKELDEKFRVFSYITNYNQVRYSPHTIINSSIFKGEIVNCSEIAYPPYGYLLTVDYKGDIDILNEITVFKKFELNRLINMPFQMNNLPVYSPFIVDYRTKEEIDIHIRKSKKTANN